MAHYLLVGASSDIAQATAQLLMAAGHTVAGFSRTAMISAYDEHYVVEGYEKKYLPEYDRPIDGLVYFPGTINLKPFHRLTREDFMADLTVNTLGAIDVVQHFLPHLKKSDHASVVFISSVAVKTGMPFHTSIGLAKAALEGLSLTLAAEYASIIRFNCVAPSLTDTNLSEKFLSSPEKIDSAMKRNPMKKIGRSEDVAQAICFLLSEQASWITGQVIAVDGGMRNLKLL